jgi:hypothetical protein
MRPDLVLVEQELELHLETLVQAIITGTFGPEV